MPGALDNRANLTTLQSRLGVQFGDASLLEQALTHRSAGHVHNERLEFLGDSVLGYTIAELLYNAHPTASEGALTRWRASLVRKPTLAEVARELQLGQYVRLGGGELKAGGRDRSSILADSLEAVLGAVLIDAGTDACKGLISRLFVARLVTVGAAPPAKDPKTRLQEWLQAQSLPLPRYEVVSIDGADHARQYRVRCFAAPLSAPVIGRGDSRRGAEQAAASSALAELDA